MALRLFISFSNRDKRSLEELSRHLSTLRQNDVLEPWTSTQIPPGELWWNAVDRNLEAADIIVLLLSANYFASRFCVDVEMRRALERRAGGDAKVMPVLLSDCRWETTPVATLQMFPTGGPIKPRRYREKAWTEVVAAIEELAQEHRSASGSETTSLSGEMFDPDRVAIACHGDFGTGARPVVIAAEAIAHAFGTWPAEPELLRAFRRNRAEIERRVNQIVSSERASRYGELFISREMLLSARSDDISGEWESHYFFQTDTERIEHSDRVVLEQTGDRVTGINLRDEEPSYEVEGVLLHGGYFVGTWRSRVKKYYKGNFQLVLTADGSQLHGTWTGNSVRVGRRAGEWHWHRVRHSKTDDAVG